jgi:uncharacterized protein
MSAHTVLFVPGLRGHVPEHWQTLLEGEIVNARAVPRVEEHKLSRAAWVAELDRTLAAIKGPVVLVAHSAGCMIIVHWAKSGTRKIKGALLAAPPDFESPLPSGYPTQRALLDNGWLPTPRARLPFPAIVAASTNDPLARIERVESFAASWGSKLVNVGAVGHLNPAAGYGPWPRAKDFIHELAQ